MFDIDHFKNVNDKFGHQVGDDVLTEVGRIVTQTCRATDVVSRYGDEEFAALLAEADFDRAFQWAETVRRAISSAKLSDQSGVPFSLTISAGVTELCATDADIDAVVNKADRALYASKASGRNRSAIDTNSRAARHSTVGPELAKATSSS